MSLFYVIFVVLLLIFTTMDSASSIKAKPLSELLPELSGLLSKENVLRLTAKKQPRQTIAQTGTAEKFIKPLTIAEMKADILAIRGQTPKTMAPRSTSTRKKIWNSSVKLESKTVSHTSNKPLKNNPVRKVLHFQPKPKEVSNMRATMAPMSPKFPKPEFRAKKSVLLQARNNVRISGINNITETPVVNKPVRSQIQANKENIPRQNNKKSTLSKVANLKELQSPIKSAIPDTPMSNESWKSTCDASFLQKEKEINDAIEKTEALSEERTLENIAEVTPPVSTPFTEYRSVKEFFNHSDDVDNSIVYHDDTIMEFEKPKDIKREDTVIISLCDLLNKTTVNGPQNNKELADLLQIEKQIEQNIKMIENVTGAFNHIKRSQLISLQSVKKLIKDKKTTPAKNADTSTKAKDIANDVKTEPISTTVPSDKRSSKPCSVITLAKSPSYKIPKKKNCLRKKVYCKSMPNISTDVNTPLKGDMGNRALSMYMKMKQQLNFLNTPVTKRELDVPDTPGMMSHNLQKQLSKLYGED